jgi:hypothetical protein
VIANLLTAALGIYLVHVAVLNHAMLGGTRGVIAGVIAAILVIALSLFARRSDYDPWHSKTVVTIAIAFLVFKLVQLGLIVPLIVDSWATFWFGLLAAFLALWAALYKPAQDTKELV